MKPNLAVDDIELLKNEDTHRNQWPVARITKVFPDANDKLVRHVQVYVPRTRSELKRPIRKLILLVQHNKESNKIK